MYEAIKTAANNILILAEKAENEKSKQKKVQILNRIRTEIERIENESEASDEQGTISAAEKHHLMKEVGVKRQNLLVAVRSEQEKGRKVSTYGKLANIFFEPVSTQWKQRFPTVAEALEEKLQATGMTMLSTTYLSVTFFTAFILLFVGSIAGMFLFYMYSIYYGFLLGVGLAFLAMCTFMVYPSYALRRKRKELTEEYPFIVSQLAAIVNSGVKDVGIFSTLLQMEQHDGIKTDAKRILQHVLFLGFSLPEALKIIGGKHVSSQISTLFLGMAKELETTGDAKKYLNEQAKTSIAKFQTAQKMHKRHIWTMKELVQTMRSLPFHFSYLFAILVGIAIVILTYYYHPVIDGIFAVALVVAAVIAWLPITIATYKMLSLHKKVEAQFFLLVKDLNKTRNPAIIEKDYKELNPYVQKLRNQYRLGLPIALVLDTFARDTEIPFIQGSIAMAREAERQGANIYEVLERITTAKLMRNISKT